MDFRRLPPTSAEVHKTAASLVSKLFFWTADVPGLPPTSTSSRTFSGVRLGVSEIARSAYPTRAISLQVTSSVRYLLCARCKQIPRWNPAEGFEPGTP